MSAMLPSRNSDRSRLDTVERKVTGPSTPLTGARAMSAVGGLPNETTSDADELDAGWGAEPAGTDDGSSKGAMARRGELRQEQRWQRQRQHRRRHIPR